MSGGNRWAGRPKGGGRVVDTEGDGWKDRPGGGVGSVRLLGHVIPWWEQDFVGTTKLSMVEAGRHSSWSLLNPTQ